MALYFMDLNVVVFFIHIIPHRSKRINQSIKRVYGESKGLKDWRLGGEWKTSEESIFHNLNIIGIKDRTNVSS